MNEPLNCLLYDLLFCKADKILPMLETILMKISELTNSLIVLNEQLAKVKTEILTRIEELQISLLDASITPAAQEALDSLTTSVQMLDDIVPDQPPS